MRSEPQGSPGPARRGLRILILAPFPPGLDAPHGGARVIAQLITHLAERHAVGLCVLRAAEEPQVDGRLGECCEFVEEILIAEAGSTEPDRWRTRLQVWRKVLSGKPLWAAGRYSQAYGERVSELAREWEPDIIQLEYHLMGQYLPFLAASPAARVLVQHEPGFGAAREGWRSRRGQGILLPYLDMLAWRRFERAVMQQVQAAVVFTERDRQTLSQNGRTAPIVQIPLGVPIPGQPLDPAGSPPPSVLFAGSFGHPPNLEAAGRLVGSIFPRVRAGLPEARLYIVGSQPPAEIRTAGGENIIVTGYVPDLKPYLDRAAVVAAPLRLGGGMRVKVLEALAAGKAVVASPLAVEGLDLVDGEQVLLAESDEEFAGAILRLLQSPVLRAAMAGRARHWACQNLSWQAAASKYEALYQGLLAGRIHD